MINRRFKPGISENLAGYTFMAPALLVLSTFVVLPILYAVFLPLQKVQLLGGIEYEFVGLRNFARLQGDERVWIALRNTAEYVAIVINLSVCFSRFTDGLYSGDRLPAGSSHYFDHPVSDANSPHGAVQY